MLKGEEALELQEKLVIIYKFISQDKLMRKFFFSGLEKDLPPKNLDHNLMVKKIVQMDNSQDILKECILELEQLKPRKFNQEEDLEGFNDKFDYIINKKNLDVTCKKYGLKDCGEIEKLDIDGLIELI
jgi:hypothetical protein